MRRHTGQTEKVKKKLKHMESKEDKINKEISEGERKGRAKKEMMRGEET